MRTTRVLLLLFLGGGCAALPSTPDASIPDASIPDASIPDASIPDASIPDAGPPALELDLRVTRQDGYPNRIYCLAETEDAGVALLVDTGSQLTFLALPKGSPDYVPDAGVLKLGPLTLTLPGRPYPVDESIDGRPVIGTLGNDFILAGTTELDLTAQKLRRIEGPWDAGGWVPLVYENVQNFMYARVQLDAYALRLGVDTGAADSLVLDAGEQPGDVPVETQDAYGNHLTFYYGFAQLSWPAQGPFQVPVLRAPSFPSFEDSNRLVGGQINGLFGLSSWPGDRVRFAPDAGTLWFNTPPDAGA